MIFLCFLEFALFTTLMPFFISTRNSYFGGTHVDKVASLAILFFSIFHFSTFDIFNFSYKPRGSHLGSSGLPFGSVLVPFLAPVGSLLVPFGSLLALFWFPLAPHPKLLIRHTYTYSTKLKNRYGLIEP